MELLALLSALGAAALSALAIARHPKRDEPAGGSSNGNEQDRDDDVEKPTP
jgi:hypothetical protein